MPGYVTDVITDKALEWLREERDAERPFLLMVQHKAPHREWAPGPEHVGDFADKNDSRAGDAVRRLRQSRRRRPHGDDADGRTCDWRAT